VNPLCKRLAVYAFLVGAAVALVAIPAAASSRGSNGRIVFARFDPVRGDDFVYTANPDGTQEQQLLATGAEVPHWSPDGTRIAVFAHAPPTAAACSKSRRIRAATTAPATTRRTASGSSSSG
jgi:hypothetical protein